MNLIGLVVNVGLSGAPMDRDGAEGCTVVDPVAPHVHGHGSLELRGLVGETDGGRVVANDGCG